MMNQIKFNDMKDKVKYYGDFNGWKGLIGFYFTKKKLRQIAKEVGIKTKEIEGYNLIDVYKLYN